jgi:hypothetical protein
MNKQIRGEAFAGHGYGTRRRLLLEAARGQIERSIVAGFFCEAIAVSESIISDRLESRLSWLTKQNVGFKTLGWLIKELKKYEFNSDMNRILIELDGWRVQRNSALHEMVKVAADGPIPDWESRPSDWQVRMDDLSVTARQGYDLVQQVYHCVAGLNPKHNDRVFPYPKMRNPGQSA